MTIMQPNGTANSSYAKIDISTQRSLKSCIATGWKYFSDNPKRYFNALWLASAIGGIGIAVAVYCISSLWAGLAVPYSLYLKSGIPGKDALAMITPSATAWTAMAVALVALIVGTCAFKGKLWTVLRNATAPTLAGTPKSKNLRAWSIGKGEIKTGITAVAIDAAFLIVLIITISAAIFAAIHTTAWLLLILIPITLYLYIIYIAYSVEKLAYAAQPIAAIKSAFGISTYRFGGMLFVTAIPAITTGILALAVCMPVAVMCFAISANAASELTGEAPGLPTYFPIMFIATSAIAFTAASLITSINLWPAMLKVASEKAKASTATAALLAPDMAKDDETNDITA